jgi:hypothetical protein
MATGTLGGTGRDYHTRQTHYVAAQIRVDNLFPTSTVVLGVVPLGAAIIRAGTVISTAFNAGTDNNVKFGDSTITNRYVLAVTGAATLGFTNYTLVASAAAAITTADTTITITGAAVGTAATAGTGIAWVEYIVV